MPARLQILHAATPSASAVAARALARHAPEDFAVSLAEIDDREHRIDLAVDDPSIDQVLLLDHAAAPAVRAALARRGMTATLLTGFGAPWPDELPAFFAAYEASDRLLVGSFDYWIRAGRLPGTLAVPWGGDANWLGPRSGEGSDHAASRAGARDGSEREDDGRWSELASRAFFDSLREVTHTRGMDTPRLSSTPGRPDLSAEVTVFVTSIAAPSYTACRELLRRQDCAFVLEVLEGITPLSAALQRMLDRCRTPYYVQVDEDMLLYPHAIRTLHERISAAQPEVAMVVGQLYDVHLERFIQGVKIARHAIARRYPWREEPSVVRRLERLEADGFSVVELPIVNEAEMDGAVGLHATHATPEMLFDRYRTLERLRRSFPRKLEWFAPYPAIFLNRFLTTGGTGDLYALLGVIAGARAGPLPAGAEVREGRLPREDLEALARRVGDAFPPKGSRLG